MFGIPECIINFDTLDLFFGRPDDDSVELKHVAVRIFCCDKLLCLTEIYTLYELDKHIGMINVKKDLHLVNYMLHSSCLPHPLIDKSSDVCLFVPDLKRGKNEDHEPTVEHYKELLEKNNITAISQVIFHTRYTAKKLIHINFETLMH